MCWVNGCSLPADCQLVLGLPVFCDVCSGGTTQAPPYNGALANNPLWTPQIDYYKHWFETYAEPDQYITIHDSKFLNLPGSYNSSHRFARAAKLPEEGYVWEWPKDIEISPRYAVDGQPETNPALMAIMGIISSVWLPKGIDDAGRLLSDANLTCA